MYELPALAGRQAHRRTPAARPDSTIWRVGDPTRYCCRSALTSCPCGLQQNRTLRLFKKADGSVCLQRNPGETLAYRGGFRQYGDTCHKLIGHAPMNCGMNGRPSHA